MEENGGDDDESLSLRVSSGDESGSLRGSSDDENEAASESVTIGNESDYSPGGESEEDSESSSIINWIAQEKKRERPQLYKRKNEEENEEDEPPANPKLSEYERIRLKNIEERASLLASLGLQELKDKMFPMKKPREKKTDVSSPSPSKFEDNGANHFLDSPHKQEADHSIEDSLTELKKNSAGHLLTRSKQAIIQGEEKIASTTNCNANESVTTQQDTTVSFLRDGIAMADCYYESEEDFQLCLAQLRSLQYDFKAPFRPMNDSWLMQLYDMKLEQKSIAKVVDGAICSIAIHPSSTCLMVCVGDANGNIAIWDVAAGECVDGIHRFTTHADAVNCLEFAPCHPEQLYAASSDGSIKCTNLYKATFDQIYKGESGQVLNYFDFLPPSSLCVAQNNGLVSIVDARSPLSEHLFRLCSDNIKTIDVHPFRKEYFLTACDGGEVNVWDLRFMTPLVQPCTCLPPTRSATSAFFSPVTGSTILSSSKDCYQRLFDSSSMVASLHLQASRKYHRAPAPKYFRPSWVPGRDDCFVVSSSQYPLRIELISSKGKELHSFYLNGLLKRPTNLTAFHPTQNILVGGSMNGSLCVVR